jgi:hypothetical protein
MLSQKRERKNDYRLAFERRREARLQRVRIKLIRKLAEQLDGIDLSTHEVGDEFDLPRREAELLIREGWAVPCDQPTSSDLERADASQLAGEAT